MDWLQRAFSGGIDAPRVNLPGILLMLAALAVAALSGGIARRIPSQNLEKTKNAIKIIALVICAGGALLAILG